MEIGLSVRPVHEIQKIGKNKQKRYISRLRGDGTPLCGMIKQATFVDPQTY
jgi:hypothetical protein